ncbi:MAG TPA: hypothetical protein VGH83_02385, partial [Candidatus Acidoferrum sp.]
MDKKLWWCAAGACFLFLLVFGAGKMRGVSGEVGPPVGIFEGHGDVGTVLHAGATEYDAAQKKYVVSGSGENMWSNEDDFQFAWKKISGDAQLTASIELMGKGGNAHRKAVLMMRQSLAADAVYADVALHGDGLTSLQYRDEKG